MKIISTLTSESSQATTRPERGRATSGGAKVQARTGDSVKVSQVAMQLAEEVSQTEDPRQAADPARLEQLRQQIEDGTYELDPVEVAAAIIEDEL